jgi:tRNA nucleotidyltransferase (CCA-adding enzyme)
LILRTCLVGGAVRDALLGLPITERDWVVVGATPEQMLAQGFNQVGRDFPVFLHPQTNEEYALARTERKQGRGYHGFACFSDPSVTLEEDLLRRDLTINAMAQCADGVIVDPYNGQADLANRKLRHVSPAFSEDPLRVLRVARFAAKLAQFHFQIADETRLLMKQMVISGELSSLTPERVWLETTKALQTQAPHIYFEVLYQVGALQLLMPELSRLFVVPQEAKWHPEGDAGVHTMMVLQSMRLLTDDIACLWAALCHDLGKGVTPKSLLPKHPEHELKGVPLVLALCSRYKVPAVVQELAVLTCRWHGDIHKGQELNAEQRLALLDGCDVWRKPARFNQLLLVCQADSCGRLGFESESYPQLELWQNWLVCLSQVSAKGFIEQGLQGVAIKQAISQQRLLLLN